MSSRVLLQELQLQLGRSCIVSTVNGETEIDTIDLRHAWHIS